MRARVSFSLSSAGPRFFAWTTCVLLACRCSVPDTTIVDAGAVTGVEASADGPNSSENGGDAGVANLIVNGDFATLGGWTFDKGTQESNDSAYKWWSGFRETSDCGAMTAPCYRVSYPANTMANGSHFGEVWTEFKVPEAGSYSLRVHVRDDCTGGQIGFYFKQVLIDDKLIWEGDVASDGIEWDLLSQDITQELLGKSSATLMLRVYLKESIHESFGISVWWDDAVIIAGPG